MLAVVLSVPVAACGGGGGGSSEPTQPTTGQASAAATTAPAPKPKDAAGVVAALRAKGLPIAEVAVYTAATDPNHLLGRPGQYTSKANFHDSRLPPPSDANELSTDAGGGVEVFPSEEGARNRVEYIERLGKNSPLFVEYDFRKDNTVLRVSAKLTPDAAAQYERALQR